jgi:hypothetical protein
MADASERLKEALSDRYNSERVLGDGEAAVSLMQHALAEGAYPPNPWHHLIEFEPLRDYPPFQELMRPKG